MYKCFYFYFFPFMIFIFNYRSIRCDQLEMVNISASIINDWEPIMKNQCAHEANVFFVKLFSEY